MFRIAVTTVLAAASFAAPAAFADPGPHNYYTLVGTTPAQTTPVNLLRDGKYLPQPTGAGAAAPAGATTPAAPSAGTTFSWLDAGIGAAVTAGSVLLVLTGFMLVARRRAPLAA